MDDFDIYGDLEDLDYKEENEKLLLENKELKDQLSKAQSEIVQLKIQNDKLKETTITLKTNFSSLKMTADRETERKDRQLQEYRSQSGNPKRFTHKSMQAEEIVSKMTQTEELVEPWNFLKARLAGDKIGYDGRTKRSRSPKDEYESHRKKLKTNEKDIGKSNERHARYDEFGKNKDCHSDKRRNDSSKNRNDNSRSRRGSRDRLDKEDSRKKRECKQLKENKNDEREGNVDATKDSRRKHSPLRSSKRELPKINKTEEKTSTSNSKEKSHSQNNKSSNDGKHSIKHVADERNRSSDKSSQKITGQEKKVVQKNDHASNVVNNKNFNNIVPETAKIVNNYIQTVQNEIFSSENIETKNISLPTKQHVDAKTIDKFVPPAKSFSSYTTKNNDVITEKQPSTNIIEKKKITFETEKINLPIDDKTTKKQSDNDLNNEHVDQTTSTQFPEMIESRQINQQVVINIEPTDVLKEINHKEHEPEVLKTEPMTSSAELNADPILVANNLELTIETENETLQKTTKTTSTTLTTLKVKTPIKSYVIEIVNDNEFSCYVSLNRKKKKKNKSQ